MLNAAAADEAATAEDVVKVVVLAEGNVCPTGGKQAFLLNVLLNEWPPLERWRSRRCVPE